jgi:hypothetical protein
MTKIVKPVWHLFLIFFPLVCGVWVYTNARTITTRYESWLQLSKNHNSIPLAGVMPDYCWCVSFLFAISAVWRGWELIPLVWKLTLWAGISSTELLQFLKMIPGTGDWQDFIAYQAAFATIILYNKNKAMKKTTFLTLLTMTVTILVIACGTAKPGTAPRETAQPARLPVR